MNSPTLAMACEHFAAVLAGVECNQGPRVLPVEHAIATMLDKLSTVRLIGGSVWIIGNGGSAAVAAHIQNDLMNKGRVRAQVLHEPSLMTCMSNDFGYPSAFARLVSHYAQKHDLLIAISSAGKSSNILNAAEAAHHVGASVVTLSGFSAENPLRDAGDINFWSPSDDYGAVEISHLFLLHYIADRLAQQP